MGGDLSARFHAGDRGIVPPKFLICNIALNLALEGATNKIRTANQFVPDFDAFIPRELSFL